MTVTGMRSTALSPVPDVGCAAFAIGAVRPHQGFARRDRMLEPLRGTPRLKDRSEPPSCTAQRRKNAVSRRRRSIVGCRRHVASTGSLTSTGRIPSNPRSTCVDQGRAERGGAAWTRCRARHLLVRRGRFDRDLEDLAFQRGHRTLHILGKGNKPATIAYSVGWLTR